MWRLFSSKEPQLLTRRVLRLKFEYCVVLRVRAPSWKDAVLSRFISEDRRMAEGKEKAAAVLQALRDAGLEALQKESKRGGVIQAVFPLHDGHWNAELLRRARRVNPFIPSSRDAFLREVRGQFGEKVAFYFAFNCFYTSWLLVRGAQFGAPRRNSTQ